ncbi:hypothetical protein BDQ17DRAFT_1174922, partial [Cyathus striatus]
ITQMITGHIALNKYLHRISKADSPLCGKCTMNAPESVEHFLFRCPAFADRRYLLLTRRARRGQQISLCKILSAPTNLSALATYINATGHLRQMLG